MAALPALRDDLALLPGPAGADGAPSWSLHDPLNNRFFRLSWSAFEILSRWHLGEAERVAGSVNAETVLTVAADDVAALAEFLADGQLLRVADGPGVDRLLARHDQTRTSWAEWLLHHYLFFRLPLLRPDSWLGRVLPWVAWLGGRGFRLATVAALLLGLLMVGRQWDSFAATFVDHFSLSGLATFGIALAFAKIVHELGHALAAKSFGCRVPTMGVAFLVLWPMLYTDVTESWKLTDRRQRLLVAGAGMLAELSIAAWAMLAWGLLPEGTARGVAFTLAVTTLVSSLAVNLSPFMRFDGYFLLMDALDQPNLHPRSFALARWHLREVLFGLDEPPPEHLPAMTRAWMIGFAWAVWIYRLALFLGIALLVYHFFVKVVGILLFAVEIGWFVLRPLADELRQWRRRLPAIRARRRIRWPWMVMAAVILLLALPWSGRVSAPAMLKADSHVMLYPPMAATLMEIAVAEGQNVKRGDVLVRLDNPDTRLRLDQVGKRMEVLRYELSAIAFDDGWRARRQSIAEELSAAQAEQAALIAEMDRLTLTAPHDGTVADLSPDLQPGQWLNSGAAILAVHSGGRVDSFVAEADLPRIALGDDARFIPEGSGPALPCTIAAIDRVAVKSLAEPALATLFGGPVAARFDHKSLVPDGVFYRVRLTPRQPADVNRPLRGQVHMDGQRHSVLGHTLHTVAAILIREWGL